MTTATRSFRRGPSGRLLGTRIDDPGFIELGALSSGHRVLGFDINKGRKAVRVIKYAAATHGFEGSLFTGVDVVQEVPYGEGVDVAALSPQHSLSPGLAHRNAGSTVPCRTSLPSGASSRAAQRTSCLRRQASSVFGQREKT